MKCGVINFILVNIPNKKELGCVGLGCLLI